MQIYRSYVLIYGDTSCNSLAEEFEVLLNKRNLENKVKLVETGCFRLCAQGPIVVIYPEGDMYTMASVEDAKEIVEEHILKEKINKRSLIGDNEADFEREQLLLLPICIERAKH
jgi:NADP-reducing hydrogenase subunit HndC